MQLDRGKMPPTMMLHTMSAKNTFEISKASYNVLECALQVNEHNFNDIRYMKDVKINDNKKKIYINL